MLAGLESLHAVVVERELSSTELSQEQLVENCLREEHQPIEEARAFRALADSSPLSGGLCPPIDGKLRGVGAMIALQNSEKSCEFRTIST